MNVLWIAAVAIVLLAMAAVVYWRRRQTRFMPPPPARLRTDLLYGYYGRDDAQCDDTAGTVNLVIELRWDALEATIARMRKQPLRTVLAVTSECWADTKTPRPADQAQALLANVDTRQVFRVAHHRSTGNWSSAPQSNYWAQPNVTLSPSGTRILVQSDWGDGNPRAPVVNPDAPVDTYVIELPGYAA